MSGTNIFPNGNNTIEPILLKIINEHIGQDYFTINDLVFKSVSHAAGTRISCVIKVSHRNINVMHGSFNITISPPKTAGNLLVEIDNLALYEETEYDDEESEDGETDVPISPDPDEIIYTQISHARKISGSKTGLFIYGRDYVIEDNVTTTDVTCLHDVTKSMYRKHKPIMVNSIIGEIDYDLLIAEFYYNQEYYDGELPSHNGKNIEPKSVSEFDGLADSIISFMNDVYDENWDGVSEDSYTLEDVSVVWSVPDKYMILTVPQNEEMSKLANPRPIGYMIIYTKKYKESVSYDPYHIDLSQTSDLSRFYGDAKWDYFNHIIDESGLSDADKLKRCLSFITEFPITGLGTGTWCDTQCIYIPTRYGVNNDYLQPYVTDTVPYYQDIYEINTYRLEHIVGRDGIRPPFSDDNKYYKEGLYWGESVELLKRLIKENRYFEYMKIDFPLYPDNPKQGLNYSNSSLSQSRLNPEQYVIVCTDTNGNPFGEYPNYLTRQEVQDKGITEFDIWGNIKYTLKCGTWGSLYLRPNDTWLSYVNPHNLKEGDTIGVEQDILSTFRFSLVQHIRQE